MCWTRAVTAPLIGALATTQMVLGAEVEISQADLRPHASGNWVATGVELTPLDPSVPVVDPKNNDAVAKLLRGLFLRGVANGFDGILYDNRDRDHSGLRQSAYPRLRHIHYAEDLRSQGADYGLAGAIFFPAVVFGNSSTAITGGHFTRSLPRFAMTEPTATRATALHYLNNHIYMYPEHRDHDAVDHFPANWPYQIISQGGSGSDQPFLRAVGATLAAFPPETLAFMRHQGLVAPTVQMILRRNLTEVNTAEEYYTGPAHRLVLRGETLRVSRMISHAASMGPDAVPPRVRIAVTQDAFRLSAGLTGDSEVLFDTPSALARMWRGVEGSRELTVSAERTEDPQGRPLTFRWVLLQGDPDKVEIEPQGADGATARIRIDWHDPFEVKRSTAPGAGTRLTSRVDIGVFAENGMSPSAPAIVSIYFPKHETRSYAKDAQGALRLQRVDYNARGRDTYFDPILFWSAPWTDEAVYAEDGRLQGWNRVFSDQAAPPVFVDAATPRDAYRVDGQGQRRTLRYTPAPSE